MRTADWYFDFISPFSYFSLLQLESLEDRLEIRYQPTLFAGLLNHWGQKGPAEITGKREWTYRWCNWWATKYQIPFRMPAAHPFNSVPYLRLALARECDPAAIRLIFEALWTRGEDASNPRLLVDLAQRLGLEPEQLQQQHIKDLLRVRTDQAIARGVFGVPTLRIDDQLFWGADALELVRDYLDDPTLFDSEEMKRLGALPVGAVRPLR